MGFLSDKQAILIDGRILHRVVVVRLRWHEQTNAYAARRLEEDRSKAVNLPRFQGQSVKSLNCTDRLTPHESNDQAAGAIANPGSSGVTISTRL